MGPMGGGAMLNNTSMDISTMTPTIIFAERMNSGVIITFEDGHVALYTDALLYATLPFAEAIDVSEDEDV